MTLEIGIYTKDLELTDRIQDYATKSRQIRTILSEIGECRVDLSHAKTARHASDRYIAQITIRGKGFILRSEERSETIFAAIDATVDKMTRQIERFKGKHWRKRAAETDVNLHESEIPEEEAAPLIARRNPSHSIQWMKMKRWSNYSYWVMRHSSFLQRSECSN